eukprot:g18632.t1
MELNTQPSGICGIVTDFVWPPMDTHQTALPVDAFGDVEKCCFFAEIGGGVQVFPGQEDPSLENSYFDEDDPVTHAPKAVRRQAEGLVVGGSAAGAAFSLGADLSLGAAGRSGYFAGRDRGKVQPVDGTSLAGAFRVLDVAVVQLLTTSTQRSESDAGAGVTGHRLLVLPDNLPALRFQDQELTLPQLALLALVPAPRQHQHEHALTPFATGSALPSALAVRVNSGSSLLRSRLANRFANTFGARGGPDTRTSGGQDEVLGACYGSASSSGDWRHASDLYYYTSQIVIWVAIIDVYAICILLLYFFNRLSVSCEGDNFLAAWLSTGLTGSLPTTILVDNIARRTTFRTAFVWESLFTLCSILWFCGGMALVISFAPAMVDEGVLQKRISCAGRTGGTTTDSNGDDPASSTTDGQLQAASASCPPAAEDDEVDIAITIEDTSCQSMLWTTCLGITLFHSTCFTLFTIFSLATTVLPALLKLVIRSLFMNANSAKKSEAAGADRASGAGGELIYCNCGRSVCFDFAHEN